MGAELTMIDGTREIIDKLLRNERVATMCGRRIYPVVARFSDAKTKYPYIVVRCNSGRPGSYKYSSMTQDEEITICTASYEECVKLSSAVYDALKSYQLISYTENFYDPDIFCNVLMVSV